MIIDDARELLVKATGGKYSVNVTESLWHHVKEEGVAPRRTQDFSCCIIQGKDGVVFHQSACPDLQTLVGYAIRAVAIYEAATPVSILDENGLDDARDIKAEMDKARKEMEGDDAV